MFDKINADMVKAMKDQNKFELSVLRMLKSALQLEKINKKDDLFDEDVIAVIKKQVKMRMDSITEFQKFNRTEEIQNLEAEIAVLKVYLPEEMSEADRQELLLPTERLFSDLCAVRLPEFFEKRYESSALKLASAVIIFLFLILYCRLLKKN